MVYEEILKQNWESKIEKIKKLIKSWKSRKLTMIGRIQVVNSLLIPQLTYLIKVLPIAKDIVKRTEQLLYKFIWEDKREKVKRNTLIRKYEDGGLKVTDLTTHIKTMLSKWVKELLDSSHPQNSPWKTIPMHILDKFGKGGLIFKMNLDNTSKLGNHVKNIPTFYQNIINSWIEIGGGQTEKPNTPTEIISQVIWGNKFIKHNNKVLIFENWINSNIIRIHDLIDENGKINENIILDKLDHKENWIAEIMTIKKSIPQDWQRKIKNKSMHKYKLGKLTAAVLLHKTSKKIGIDKLDNKLIYTALLEKNTSKPLANSYWSRTMNISSTTMNKTLQFIFREIHDNKIKMFRWKLLNRILPTKQLLHKWKISENPLCNSCGEIEDYQHTFIDCNYHQHFHNILKTLFEHLGFQKEMMTIKNITFGYKIQYTEYNMINYIITFASYSIYRAYYISEIKTKQVNTVWLLKDTIGTLVSLYKHRQQKIPSMLQKTCHHLNIPL